MASLPTLHRRSFIAGAAGLCATVALHPFSARAQANQTHLRLMGTTDLHVNVFPYDYYADKEVDTVGLARTAAIVASIRAEAKNALLFDNGDFLQGNPMGDYIAYERGMKEGDVHPVIAAMNVLAYDAGTLGNHEFNYGLPFLQTALKGAAFPFVSANLARGALAASPAEDARFVPPTAILERMLVLGDGSRRPIKVGVVGFLPPQIMVWDAAHLTGEAATRGIVEAAKAHVPALKAAGADLVVALCHSGIAAEAAGDPMAENAALELAGVEGIDAIFTGHQHLQFPGKDFEGIAGADAKAGRLAGKPAVMAGFWGSHLGLIDLLLEKDGDGWRIADATCELRPISERVDKAVKPLVESRKDVLDAARADHEATLAYVRTPVGETSAPLHSYFALVADDPSVQIVNKAQAWYMKAILAQGEFAALPLLSAAAPFKAGGRGGPAYYTDIAAGPVAIKNVADLYLYPNTVRAVRIDGATVREWLERSAGLFNRLTPGTADQPLIAPGFPSYNFDVIDGVTYRIDLSKPARYGEDGTVVDPDARRIVDLAYDGKPIDEGAEFIVATNNYRAGGGGKFPGLSEEKIVYVAPDANRDVLVRYIHEEKVIDPAADANWSFVPLPGTSATFETGPAGRAYAASVKGARIEPLGEGQNGFALYRLVL
ncbi:bifunctional 2',3'-cyclic-nucleotide 2'-phosphodiesterase/3'-nucleotidase [Aurantimonas sp. Leaf443]|uniref:bifunctional 2',3'-cyclic-nucleotide 2'-phosphodiesterase/3'-nucleotidase n=1 Tax=Aurantimonas sp. Leaf443 TaxID=1736378 RepID=UPI0006FE6A15|nr:bifunctional 2',3'-cyclic-nucleotide 2'-phosphodiesterase/3'-nucleotidase [Aurantimonas sp. Leaf443]KQT88486.1 2', 3'-cyclic nucleotide 2'-phosphodiesterase [Aurantimonas sp. Leaf443]